MTPSKAVARLLLAAALLPSCGLLSSLGGSSEDAAAKPPKEASVAAAPSASPGPAEPNGQGVASSEEVVALRAELEALREDSARRVAEAEAREYDLRLEFDRVRGQLAAWQQERPPVPWTLWLAGASLLAAFLAILSSWQASRAASRLHRLIESLELEVELATNPVSGGPAAVATTPARAAAPEPGAPPGAQAAPPRPAARLRKRPPVG